MSAEADKLAHMANQIAGFFAAQRGDAALKVADHLVSFWAPSMRQAIVAHMERTGGAGLSPIAAQAVAKLRDASPLAVERALQAAGETSPAHMTGDDAG